MAFPVARSSDCSPDYISFLFAAGSLLDTRQIASLFFKLGDGFHGSSLDGLLVGLLLSFLS